MDNYEHRLSQLERAYDELVRQTRQKEFDTERQEREAKREISVLQSDISALKRKLLEHGIT